MLFFYVQRIYIVLCFTLSPRQVLPKVKNISAKYSKDKISHDFAEDKVRRSCIEQAALYNSVGATKTAA